MLDKSYYEHCDIKILKFGWFNFGLQTINGSKYFNMVRYYISIILDTCMTFKDLLNTKLNEFKFKFRLISLYILTCFGFFINN